MPYSDPVVHYEFTANGKELTLDALQTILEAATWTSEGTAAIITGTFTGQPANNNTIVITSPAHPGGVTLTAKTSPAAGTEFALGSTPTEAASNLTTCINNNLTDITATSNAGVVTMTSDDTGSVTITATESLNNFTVNFASMSGGFKFSSAATSQLLTFRIWAKDIGDAAKIRLFCGSTDGGVQQSTGFAITTNVSRVLRAIAWPEALVIYFPTDSATVGAYFFAATGWIAAEDVGLEVTGVASNGGLVEITTGTPHGYSTGQLVYVSGILGATGGNGAFNITVTGSNTFTLDGSTFGGSYTSGGVVGDSNSVSQVFLAQGDEGNAGTTRCRFRQCIYTNGTNSQTWHYNVFNGQSVLTASLSSGKQELPTLESSIAHRSGHYPFTDAWVKFNTVSMATEGVYQFIINNCALIPKEAKLSENNGDQVEASPDETDHGWWIFTDPATDSNTGADEGSLAIRVPATGTAPLLDATITVI